MNNSPDPMQKKQKWTVAFFTLAIIFVALIYIINAPTIRARVNAFLSVLSPIFIGAFIAYLANPLLKIFEFKVFKRLKSKNSCRVVSMVCTYIVIALIITLILILIIPQLSDGFTDLADNFNSYIDKAVTTVNDFFNRILNDSSETHEYINEEKLQEHINAFFNTSGDLLNGIFSLATSFGMSIINGIKNILIGLVLSFYFLYEKERIAAIFKKVLNALCNKKTFDNIMDVTRYSDRTFGRFIIGQLIDAVIVGFVSLVVYAILGIPYFPLIAFIVAITNVIPIIGPFIGAIPSAFIIFVISPAKTIPFIISVIIIQQIDGNIIAPRIIGNSTGLSSLGVLIAIVAMSGYFGAIGLYLGVPFFAVIYSLAKGVVNKRLSDKSMSVDTADYYPEDSIVDPRKHYEKHSILRKLFNFKKHKAEKQSNGNADPDTFTGDGTQNSGENDKKDNK